MTTSINPQLNLTLDDAVGEVLTGLYGLDLEYDSSFDRYRTITRALNRALRDIALEHEWSYFATTSSLGAVVANTGDVAVPNTMRPRVTGDDAVRLVDAEDHIVTWAYFLPRDAVHKYVGRPGGLWVAFDRDRLVFSRKFRDDEAGLDIQLPIMREPAQFALPPAGDPVDPAVRAQPIDFAYPDLVIARATWLYAQTDPVIQPRVQTLEAAYKDRMYQLIERDDRSTDSPFLNEFFVPIRNGLSTGAVAHNHPHSDERWW